jgi:hypothetical protein
MRGFGCASTQLRYGGELSTFSLAILFVGAISEKTLRLLNPVMYTKILQSELPSIFPHHLYVSGSKLELPIICTYLALEQEPWENDPDNEGLN